MRIAITICLMGVFILSPVSIQGAGQTLGQMSTESQKINLAVLTLKNASGISEGEASLISDRLRGELFNTGRANVMERDQMSEILKEQGFQQSGVCTDEACLVQMGQMLGVQAIVTGSIGKLGSMYLINFRVIDVKTGKITAVVSRDLKGDIEDVVEFLKDIATELVNGAAGKKSQGSAVRIESAKREEVRVEEKPVEEARREEAGKEEEAKMEEAKMEEAKMEEAKMEEAKMEEAKMEEAKMEEATVDGDREDLNKNKGGMRLMIGMNPGGPQFSIDGSSYEPFIENTTTLTAYRKTEFAHSPLVRLDVDFMIKAGPVLVVDIAPTIQWQSLTYGISYQDYSSGFGSEMELQTTIGTAGLQPGLRFVKRWHPIKLNIGAFADLGFAWWNSSLSGTATDASGFSEDISSYLGDTLLHNFGATFLFAPGLRTGVEYLIKNRVGFNLDFMFRWAAPSFTFIQGFDDTSGTNIDKHYKMMLNYTPGANDKEHPPLDIILPMFGLDFGINFYF